VRLAVTGASGRLGRAIVAALDDAPYAGPSGAIAWSRPAFDLDDPEGFAGLLDRDRPELVIHAAAWTDVDGCARDPELALARNGDSTAVLARTCAERGLDLVVISTNEVFDGRRTDGRPYSASDDPSPANAYGRSKLAGERAAAVGYANVGAPPLAPYTGPADRPPDHPQLAIVRTAWLFGPPGGDFPAKIVLAAERARADGSPLRVVGDEVGDPTAAVDLADAIVELIGAGSFQGLHHQVNAGPVSRAGWARAVLAGLGLPVEVVEVPQSTWQRPSTPPRFGALETTPLPSGEAMAPWTDALARDLPWRRRARASAAAAPAAGR
jgi:dTDP-4-dehydrorhamnose reductase